MPLFGPPNIDKLKARRDVDGLIKALGYKKDWNIRQHAAQALGKISDVSAVEPLIAALKDSEVAVRKNATEALGKIGDARATEPLIAALKDSDKHVRWEAVVALGKINDPRAVEPLIAALKDSEIDVCRCAAGMLEKIGWQPGRDESGALYWILKDEWAKCTEIGALAVGLLLSALNDSNWDVRQNAAKALGTIGDARAIEPLITGLKDRDKNVQWAATEALGKMGSPAVHSLIAALKDSYSRKFAVIALGEIGDARAVEPLIAMLNDNDCDLRIKIVRALGVIGNPHAVGPLIAALKDSELDVRRCAAEALEKIGWQPGQDESGTYYWMGKNNWEKCVEIGAPAVEPLTVALKDNDGSVRQRAAKALGEVNDARAVEPLITALKDRDKFVRQTAAEALGEIGDPRAIERLIVVLNDHTGTVRHAAATALVVMYQRLKLDDQTIQQILAQRTKIVISHEDRAYCNLHTDEGIGVEFPL